MSLFFPLAETSILLRRCCTCFNLHFLHLKRTPLTFSPADLASGRLYLQCELLSVFVSSQWCCSIFLIFCFLLYSPFNLQGEGLSFAITHIQSIFLGVSPSNTHGSDRLLEVNVDVTAQAGELPVWAPLSYRWRLVRTY